MNYYEIIVDLGETLYIKTNATLEVAKELCYYCFDNDIEDIEGLFQQNGYSCYQVEPIY